MPRTYGRFEDKTIVVTGGGSGIGLQTAKDLHRDGAYVHIIGRNAEKLAKDKDAPEIETEIQKHLEVARNLGIQGTPGFLIDEKVFRGYIPYDAMKSSIKEIRDAKAKQ